MATKKKSKKKQTKPKKTATKKASAKKAAVKKATKAKIAARKKPALKAKHAVKKSSSRKTAAKTKKRVRGKSENVDTLAFEPVGLGARSGGQSGDLQGLSDREGADSESVDELLEEGNAYEAEVVKGVQDAGDADEREVRTHEVPEDDVPGEYLGKDE
jgi:hypothetical protein